MRKFRLEPVLQTDQSCVERTLVTRPLRTTKGPVVGGIEGVAGPHKKLKARESGTDS